MARRRAVLPLGVLFLAGTVPLRAFSQDMPVDYPAALPPEAAVRATMSQSTRVRAGLAQIDIGRTQARKLRAGPYEWETAVTARERKDLNGQTYADQQYELIRRWRLPGKGSLDRRMGVVMAGMGENAFADAWHETGRTLLSAWFDWLRAAKAEQLLEAQDGLVTRESDVLSRRVARGDAPRLDLQRAEVGRAQMQATLAEAKRRTEEARLLLQRDFPELPQSMPAVIARPAAMSGSDESWIETILMENHEIELAQGRADAAALQATRAQRDRVPDPSIAFQFSDNLDQNRQVIGVRVSIPISAGGRAADAALARSQATLAEVAADQVRRDVEATARIDIVNARASWLQWQRFDNAAVQADAAATAVARGYEVGELSITELLLARRQQLEAQMQAEEALLNAHEARARLWLDAHRIWAPDESGFKIAR